MATKKDSMLPEDSVDINATELRVNFSDEEASSEAFSFEPLPSGRYPVTITEWEMKRSTSEKHNGKPYWALTLRVNDEVENYGGRKLWANIMLFEGALYSLSQLMKALGGEFEEVLKTGKIPHGDSLVGKEVIAVVAKKVDKWKIDQGEWDGTGPKPMKNDVSGFKPINAGSMSSGGSNSLMP